MFGFSQALGLGPTPPQAFVMNQALTYQPTTRKKQVLSMAEAGRAMQESKSRQTYQTPTKQTPTPPTATTTTQVYPSSTLVPAQSAKPPPPSQLAVAQPISYLKSSTPRQPSSLFRAPGFEDISSTASSSSKTTISQVPSPTVTSSVVAARPSYPSPKIGKRICCPPETLSCGLHRQTLPNVYFDGSGNEFRDILNKLKTPIGSGATAKAYTVNLDADQARSLGVSPGNFVIRGVELFPASTAPANLATLFFNINQLQEFAISHTLDFPLISPCATIVTPTGIWYLLERATADLSKTLLNHPNTVNKFPNNHFSARVPDDTRIRWAYQLIVQLFHMHRMGYTHGDIKVDNVLVFKEEDTVQITDFGFAASPWIPTAWSGSVVLPEWFLSNGHLKNTQKTPRNKEQHDTFSLGIVLAILFGVDSHLWTMFRRPFDIINRDTEQVRLIGQYLRLMGVTPSTLDACLNDTQFDSAMKSALSAHLDFLVVQGARNYPCRYKTLEQMLDEAACPPVFKTLIFNMLTWNIKTRIDNTVDVLSFLREEDNQRSLLPLSLQSGTLHTNPEINARLRKDLNDEMVQGETLWITDYDKIRNPNRLTDQELKEVSMGSTNMQKVKNISSIIAAEVSSLAKTMRELPHRDAIAEIPFYLCITLTQMAFWERLLHFYTSALFMRMCFKGTERFDVQTLDVLPNTRYWISLNVEIQHTIKAAFMIIHTLHSDYGLTKQTASLLGSRGMQPGNLQFAIANMLADNAGTMDYPTPAVIAIYYLAIVKQVDGMPGCNKLAWHMLCKFLLVHSIRDSLTLLPVFHMNCSIHAALLLTKLASYASFIFADDPSYKQLLQTLLGGALDPSTFLPLLGVSATRREWFSFIKKMEAISREIISTTDEHGIFNEMILAFDATEAKYQRSVSSASVFSNIYTENAARTNIFKGIQLDLPPE